MNSAISSIMAGLLFLYPMKEFPYWRAIMPRTSRYSRMVEFRKNHPSAMDETLGRLARQRGDGQPRFQGNGLSQWSYRGRKDSAVALFYLWLLGEVMITTRKGFDRVYDLRERVAPREVDFVAPIKEAEDFFARKTIAMLNLMRAKRFRVGWQDAIEREVTANEAEKKLSALIRQGTVNQLKVEGNAETWLAVDRRRPMAGIPGVSRIPKPWQPLESSTEEEVTFLAPLEMVSARGRAKQVFDFEYFWEVYKPVHQRRWGYYTLPILYGMIWWRGSTRSWIAKRTRCTSSASGWRTTHQRMKPSPMRSGADLPGLQNLWGQNGWR